MEGNNVMDRNISYLRARDPSILTFNRPHLSEVRTNLIEEFCNDNNQQEQDHNIRVFLRIKNGYDFNDLYEVEGDKLTSKVPPGSNFLRNVKEGDSMLKTYTFTKIFGPGTTQKGIFDDVVKPKILDFINGQTSTLLTYGASGSGKTFTVIGTDQEPGVVPRSLEYLFRTLPQISKDPFAKPLPTGEVTILSDSDCRKEKLLCESLLNASSSSVDKIQHVKTYSAMQQRLSNEPVAQLEDHSNISIAVWVSFAEIYNEQIFDLLQFDPPRGKQRPRLRLGMSNGQAYIKNLCNVSVSSGQEAYQILQHGIHNLNYAPTRLNSHSSRSHSIFTIKLVQVSNLDGGSFVSTFNFCDLAGSERSKKTLNAGDRLKESNSINSSLLVLGRCISAVRNLQKQDDNKMVPFRESKLTQLFQRALGGYEDIAMIVNISPSREMFDESQHVLNFSAVAKEISIERKLEPRKKKNRFSQLVEKGNDAPSEEDDGNVEQLRNAVLFLQNELEQQRNEFEVTEKLNRDYVIQGYEKLMEEVEVHTKKRIEDAKDYVRVRYEQKLRNMSRKYEQLLKESEQKSNVIEISSSDEESDDSASNKKKLQVLNDTLNEGVRDFRELKEKYQLLENEYMLLKEKCCELETELMSYRQERTDYVNESDDAC